MCDPIFKTLLCFITEVFCTKELKISFYEENKSINYRLVTLYARGLHQSGWATALKGGGGHCFVRWRLLGLQWKTVNKFVCVKNLSKIWYEKIIRNIYIINFWLYMSSLSLSNYQSFSFSPVLSLIFSLLLNLSLSLSHTHTDNFSLS